MSFLKDIGIVKKTPEEQEMELKRLEAQTKKIQAQAKRQESLLEARERLSKARQRLAKDKARARQSSVLGKTFKGIKDFVSVPDNKQLKKSVKSKGKKPKKKSGKGGGFIEDFLPF